MRKLGLIFISNFLALFPFTIFAQNYFQQEVNYTINVKLDDVKHELTADERIEYINNSPSTLTFIYMHLWPNAYKDNNTALAKQLFENGDTKFYYSGDDDKGYIDQIDFKINNLPAKWELLKDSIDICKLYLNEPLKPGEKIIISTPFHVKIPSGVFSRLGHLGQSYQITQWYPKPAVYDNNGWNYMPYLTQGEFYSEFGSFDVSITLPKNYVLGATGDMVDGERELEWLNQKVKETEALTSYNRNDLAFPVSDAETKTLRFVQKNVHDFAWFCDKRYHVLKGEIQTPHAKHKVTTWTMFTNAEAHLWKNSIQYMNDAIYYYSLWNGDYPYNHCTAVDGTISAGGGMEYPNITVIGTSKTDFLLDLVITHEVGHNWFYGMLGSNERIHPWMDEGINSFNENRYVKTKYPDQKLLDGFPDFIGKKLDLDRYKHKTEYELTYLISAAQNKDQAIETPAYEYTELNYGGDVYHKSALVFDYLMAYIGEKKMDEAMRRYFNEWHFKHPQPNDLRKILEEVSGKNLSWFFDELIGSTKKLDYKITSARQTETGMWDIGIKNTGDVKGPVFIQGIKDNKPVGMLVYDGFTGKQILNFPPSKIDYFKIDFKEDMPEINRNNNIIRTKGLFKKAEPLKFQFLGSLDRPDKTQIFWTPVAGWNNYNKWMFGLALYNNVIPQKKFEYVLMPLLSYSTNDFAGYGRYMLNFFPKNKYIQKISFGASAARYAFSNAPFDMNFNKIAPELFIELKKDVARSPIKNTIRYRSIFIIQDYYKGNYEFSPPVYSRDTLHYNIDDLTWEFSKKDPIMPYSAAINAQVGKKIAKLGYTIKWAYNFKKKNKGVDIRLFAGTFINPKTEDAGPYRFRLSGQRGYQDYLYDNIYLGRTETDGVLASQFSETDGAFKFYSPLGQSSKWIAALNIKSSLGNLKLPVNVFADIGTSAEDGINTQKLLYDAGLSLSIIKNVFEIYFPLLIAKDFNDYKDANDITFPETIRFTLNLSLANPFDLIRNFEL